MRVRLCLIHGMFQPDLFTPSVQSLPVSPREILPLDLPGILERLSHVCSRPRYCFMVLNLIAKASAATGYAGPYVIVDGRQVPVRDWLCDALVPVAHRDPRRHGIAQRVRLDLQKKGLLPQDIVQAEQLIAKEVGERIRLSGLTNVSRAVTELVRAGLVRRHYQGIRVDHQNRGAGRQAVYAVTEEVRKALG